MATINPKPSNATNGAKHLTCINSSQFNCHSYQIKFY